MRLLISPTGSTCHRPFRGHIACRACRTEPLTSSSSSSSLSLYSSWVFPLFFALWNPLIFFARAEIQELDLPFLNVALAESDMPPASYIFSSEQLWPPYDLDAHVMDPSKRCDATQAALCGIQNAIRLVTRARMHVCPELEAGGARREEAFRTVTAGNYSSLITSATGFDIFIFDKQGVTLADGLRPDFVGLPIYGRNISGSIPQKQVLSHADWVVKWNGGFVPHFSKRLQDGDPIAVVSYVEACSGSDDRIAVSLARQNTQIAETCSASSDQMCAQRTNDALQGLAMLELLSAKNAQEFSHVLYKISFSDLKVSDFSLTATEMSWKGYPGEDPYQNPSPLSDTYSTVLAEPNTTFIGFNHTKIYGGTNSILSDLNNAAWTGGGWRHLPAAQQVHLASGITWNRTLGVSINGGFSHSPKPAEGGPLCTDCVANYSLACALVNAESLSVHARADMLVPDYGWDRLTYLKWFGASHNQARTAETAGPEIWPDGFYVAGFSYAGDCVAHAANYSLVGKTSAEVFGNEDAHRLFLSAAAQGDRWVPFVDNGIPKLAHIQDFMKNGSNYYIISPINKAWAPLIDLDTCSASKLERCSTWNAEAVLGGAAGEILGSFYEAEMVEVVRQMETKEGLFSSDSVGDFQVHLYDADFRCWSQAEAAGIPCPPKIVTGKAKKIRSALGSSIGATSLQLRINSLLVVAFVLHIPWRPLDRSSLEDFYAIVFVEQETTNPTCVSDDDCPANSACSATGRCLCSQSLTMNASFVFDDCGENLVPTEMNCVDIDGLICDFHSDHIDLAECRPCEEGYFCRHGLATECPRGQYCPGHASSPLSCPKGNVANTTGSATCTPCSVGTASSWAASFECTSCMSGTFAGTPGQSMCDSCLQDSYSSLGQASCTQCPGGSFASGPGASSISECRHCKEGYYFNGMGCQKCFWGLDAPDSDATSCSLAPFAQVSLSFLGAIILLTVVLIVLTKRTFRKRIAALKQQAAATKAEKLQQAVECKDELSYPLSVMNVETFLNLADGQISMSHQDHRDKYRVRFFDTYQAVQAFQRAGHQIIFVSYDRTACSGHRGLPEELYLAIRQAILEVIATTEWEAEQTYVWIDRISVHQDHALMQNLATDSLYMYAKCADLLLVVCPPSAQTPGSPSSLESYQRQAWCRAEVLAHCCAHGPEDVLIFDDTGLRVASAEWLLMMRYVFEGEFPCCSQRGHENRLGDCRSNLLVMPMLALYCDGIGDTLATVSTSLIMLTQSKSESSPSGLHFFQTKVLPEKDRVFPPRLRRTYRNKDGKVRSEEQELFADFLKVVAKGTFVSHRTTGVSRSSSHLAGQFPLADDFETLAVTQAI